MQLRRCHQHRRCDRGPRRSGEILNFWDKYFNWWTGIVLDVYATAIVPAAMGFLLPFLCSQARELARVIFPSKARLFFWPFVRFPCCIHRDGPYTVLQGILLRGFLLPHRSLSCSSFSHPEARKVCLPVLECCDQCGRRIAFMILVESYGGADGHCDAMMIADRHILKPSKAQPPSMYVSGVLHVYALLSSVAPAGIGLWSVELSPDGIVSGTTL